MEPLNHAPSSMEILWQVTSPPSEPSFLISDPVACGDVAFYFAQNNNFFGIDVGLDLAIAANRYTVTRQIDGAFDTRPSIYNDSEPATSPLMTSDFPMVACSVLLRTALRRRGDGRRLAGESRCCIGAHNWLLRFRSGFWIRVRRRASRLPHFVIPFSFFVRQCSQLHLRRCLYLF